MLDANIATTILPGRAREDLLEPVDHVELRSGEALAIDVRAVGEQRQHARRPELREPMEVHVLAVERRLVDLEVAGVNHHAARRVNRDRHAVGHAVRHAQELDRERPDLHAIARPDASQPRLRLAASCSSSFGLDQRQRQRRAVHRPVEVRQHVRHGADVILVPVRQHQRRRPCTAAAGAGPE